MYFNTAQSACLDSLAQQIKLHTGTRLTTVVVDRSGSYPEIPWKAFALAVCAHAVIHLLQTMLEQDRILMWSVQRTLGFVIGSSAGIALLTQYWQPFGTIFLDRSDAQETVRRHAESLFLKHEIFNTPARNGILMLVSLFECQVVIVPDSGIAEHLDQHARKQVIDAMFPLLRRQDYFGAVEKGLQIMEIILPANGSESLPQDDVVLPEAFIQLKIADI